MRDIAWKRIHEGWRNGLLLCMFWLGGSMVGFSSTTEHYFVKHYSVEDGLSQKTVMSILQDRQGYMWFGTWDGLNRFDGYNFLVFKAMNEEQEAQVNHRVDLIYEDEDEQLWWMTYDRHFYMLDKSRQEMEEKEESEIPAGMREKMERMHETLMVDDYGIAWQVNDNEGISRYRDGKWKTFKPALDSRYAGQLDKNLIVLEDLFGRTWVNPTGGGWSYYDIENDVLVNPLDGQLTNMIHTAYVDREGLMWVATYDGGVDCINMEPQPYSLHDLRRSPRDLGEVRAFVPLSNGEIQKIVKNCWRVYCGLDGQHGRLYGTKGNGLKRTSGGQVATSHANIYDIVEGDDGTLYIATYGDGINILHFNAAKGSYDAPIVAGKGLNVRTVLLQDDILWGGTTKGLLRVDLRDMSSKLLPCYDVRALYFAQGKLWIGTFGGGLRMLDVSENDLTIQKVNTIQDIVMSMTGDEEHLWFCSEKDITQLHIQTGECQYFNALEGHSTAWFTEAKAVRQPDGTVLFGYTDGYCSFDPRAIYSTKSVPPVQIISCYTTGGQKMDITKPIEIAHNGDFCVEYAALEYVGSDKISYSYKLEGLQNEWTDVYDQRRLLFSNLRHGHYVLHVRSTNREGMEVANEVVLPIYVKPSVWSSWWAICLYIIGILVLIAAISYVIWSYNMLQQKIKVEQQVTDIKLRFFTNISHELRTPLTLIIGPVTNILNTERLSNGVRGQLEIVLSNSQRMLRMVNQLLDFRKIQNNKMRLKVQKSNLGLLADDTCANFKKEAYDKHINFTVVKKAKDSTVWVDRSRVDTILFNLLSNAFKFTPSGKRITVVVDEKPGYVMMVVKDEGIGIPMEKRNVLFERFSSNNELSNQNNNTGTGIGMNLIKELVDLHHGYIEVESEVGKGSTFTVLFQRGTKHFGQEVDIVVDDTSTSLPETPKETLENKLAEIEGQQDKRRMVLVVDDNEDMRTFLSNILGSDYRVRMAGDGREALKAIEQEIPDVVVTDLMMPNMDGLELTKQLKQSQDLTHVPVILLSAKSAIESRLQAMQEGADDYVTKPFEPEYLRARVKNLIKQRQILEASYRQRLMRLDPQSSTDELKGDSFLAKLLNIMDKQMDNNTLTVDELVDDMGMGRTVFFNKLKSLTGLSPVEFIREMRIKRAAQLLEQKNYNITEVTYMVGMNDSRYFAKCFKATYGMTPSEYRKQRLAELEKESGNMK